MLNLCQPTELDDNQFLITDNRTYTYNEVFELADKIFDNQKKEVVLILCDKSVETILVYVAALKHNKVPLLVDSTYKQELISRFIENYDPKYIFSSLECSFFYSEKYIPIQNELGFIQLENTSSFKYPILDELALLIPTSGSTGDPKCVRVSKENIDACTKSICEYLDFSSSRVSISLLPIHYSFGLSVLHNTIYKRAKYVISNYSVLDKEIWREFDKHKVTDFSGVPFIMKILNKLKLDFESLSSLKYVMQAGGYLSDKESKSLFEKFSAKGISYFTMYGQTEASPRISYLAPEYAELKPGSAGKAISCGQVYLTNINQETKVGELIYRGKNVALGYADNAADLNNDDEFLGLLHTGDLAKLDDEGYIWIIGRKKRFIKLNGVSVNLDSLEKDLACKETNIAVVGRDDLLVLVSTDENVNELRLTIASNYGFNKRSIKAIKVDFIPLNSSGKTDYKSLTESFCEI